MNISPPDEYLKNDFSNQIKVKLEEINNNENKINDVLLKKITEFIKETKELNKSSPIDLNKLKTSMKNVQKDVENLKENYKILQLKNKDLLVKLQNINKLKNSTDVDHFEQLPRKRRKLINENNYSNKSTFAQEGFL